MVNLSIDGLHGDGQLTIALFGIAGVVLLVSASRGATIAGLLTSGLATLIAGYDLANISNIANKANQQFTVAQISPGVGIYLCVVGGVISVVGSFIGLSKK